jgi:hypothetical protein
MNKSLDFKYILSVLMLRPSARCSCSVLGGQVLEHVLRLGARARYRAPNARALLIIGYDKRDSKTINNT